MITNSKQNLVRIDFTDKTLIARVFESGSGEWFAEFGRAAPLSPIATQYRCSPMRICFPDKARAAVESGSADAADLFLGSMYKEPCDWAADYGANPVVSFINEPQAEKIQCPPLDLEISVPEGFDHYIDAIKQGVRDRLFGVTVDFIMKRSSDAKFHVTASTEGAGRCFCEVLAELGIEEI